MMRLVISRFDVEKAKGWKHSRSLPLSEARGEKEKVAWGSQRHWLAFPYPVHVMAGLSGVPKLLLSNEISIRYRPVPILHRPLTIGPLIRGLRIHYRGITQ